MYIMNNSITEPRNTPRNLGILALVPAAVLMIPFVANWPWTLGDYVVMGVLIMSIGLIYELIARTLSTKTYRIIVAIVLFVAFLLIWAELAVGIFNTPFAGS